MDDNSEFYITLFSTTSQKMYTNNKHSAHTIQLARTIELAANYRWVVGACEDRYPPPKDEKDDTIKVSHCFTYVDIISTEFVGNQLVRCLRTFLHTGNLGYHVFDNIYYVPVETKKFQIITVEFRTIEGNRFEMPDSKVPSKLVLHFRRVPTW